MPIFPEHVKMGIIHQRETLQSDSGKSESKAAVPKGLAGKQTGEELDKGNKSMLYKQWMKEDWVYIGNRVSKGWNKQLY